MDVLRHRQRSSSNTSFTSNRNDAPGAQELRQTLDGILDRNKSTTEKNAKYIKLQIDALRHVQSCLQGDKTKRLLRQYFRHVLGFETVLDTLQIIVLLDRRDIGGVNGTAQSVESLEVAIDILRICIRSDKTNRRYVVDGIKPGGWTRLQKINVDFCAASVDHKGEGEDGLTVCSRQLDMLFSMAFDYEGPLTTFQDVVKQQPRASASPSPADHLLRGKSLGQAQPMFKTGLIVQPEATLIAIDVCLASLSQKSNADDYVSLFEDTLACIYQTVDTSLRNRIVLHTAGLTSKLISDSVISCADPFIHRTIVKLTTSFFNFGCCSLSDAYSSILEALTNTAAAERLLKGTIASRSPDYIHFDLALHGYSSIELPTLGRPFPPTSNSNGYTLCAWVRIDSFDSASHTTLFGAYDASQTCFVLAYLEKDTRHLILQTSVKNIKQPSVRFRSVTFSEHKWYHVAIVHRRPRTTSSSKANLFVNGHFAEQLKCTYPSSPPSASAHRSNESFASLSSGIDGNAAVQAFLGTPQDLALRHGENVNTSAWSLASFHLFSDTISDELIAVIEKVGPRYSGNYQDCLGSFLTYRSSAALNRQNELLNPGQDDRSEIVASLSRKASFLLPEQRVMISLSASNVIGQSQADRDVQDRLEQSLSKEAARMLHKLTKTSGASIIINAATPNLNENITSAAGIGVLTGDPVVMSSLALDDAFWRTAGSSAIALKLIEVADDKHKVIRAVSTLFSAIEDSWRASESMEREKGYDVLASLLRDKLGFGDSSDERVNFASPVDPSEREELALELLRLVLKFLGYDEDKPELSFIINPMAYRTLLIDFDTWRKTPIATQKLYYIQFVHFTMRNNQSRAFNTKRLAQMHSIRRLIDALKGEAFLTDVFPDFMEAFSSLLHCNISKENLRSLALFVTYAFEESRALPSQQRRDARVASLKKSDQSIGSQSPVDQTFRGSNGAVVDDRAATLSLYETGVQILEAFTEVICDPSLPGTTEKFAKTVTNKWLLFMLDEHDPRVIFLTLKFIGRVLFVHGPRYVDLFANKNGGFTIMKQRLKGWWNLPAVWIMCFALLFGYDVSTINFDIEFNHFNLAEIFSQRPVQVICPDVFPIITAMLQSGLKSIVDESGKSSDDKHNGLTRDPESAHLKRDITSPLSPTADLISIHRLANDAEVLQTIVRFLTDLYLKWPGFREYAIGTGSTYVQDLLFVLYPVIITSDSVSAETELNSKGSALTFEGQDVVIRTPTASGTLRPPIVRTSTAESPGASTGPRALPFRRASSFVLISPEVRDKAPSYAKFNAVMSPTSAAPVSLRIGNAVVEGLLQVVTGVLLDQVLERREFTGFGLFLKVPPGFQEHQVYFESYMLKHAMSSLSNNLRLNQKLMTEPKILNNLARYCHHMAEAVFEGWFLAGAEPLLDFIGTILEHLQRPEISKLKTVRLCSQAIHNMRMVFLRIALLRLSELDADEAERKTVAFLEKLIYWQTVILTTSQDAEEDLALRLIFYLLYIKLVSGSGTIRFATVNLWRMLLAQKPNESYQVLLRAAGDPRSYLADGFTKMTQVDNDTFFIWFDKNRIDLDQVFLGALARQWEAFVNEENCKTEETANHRMHKRREKLKVWQANENTSAALWRRHESGTSHWRGNVFTAERVKHQRSLQDQQENLESMAVMVDKFDSILKGSCGLIADEKTPKWRLDQTESRDRMRARLILDKVKVEEDFQPKRKTAAMLARKPTLKVDTSRSPSGSSNTLAATPTQSRQGDTIGAGRQRSSSQASAQSGMAQEDEYEIVEGPNEDDGGFEDKNRKVMRALQRGDSIQHIYNVSRIVGLEAVEGLLILGKHNLYLHDHFFQRADGEVLKVWQAPMEERDPYLQMILGKQASTAKKPQTIPGERSSRNWRWADVLLISKRRFIFRDVAIEIFFTDGQSFLLTAIQPYVRDDLFSRLSSKSPLLRDTSSVDTEDAWRLDSLRHPEEAPQSLGSKFANVFQNSTANSATRKWARGEMSNFAYLMLLNTMAGRTFNDLTQYPVFPWILADYTSDELDLTNPRTFRDLSKPMGAQIPAREQDFRERYKAIADMDPTKPAFHYGTHYSSAMVVSSYLIRLQPFVQSYLLLQGGSFDHADRLFSSIEKAWLSASKDSTTDVRELTPEFFYLPEFLVNLNEYNFGLKQHSGEAVNNVVLPPWAKGDPHIFIAKHREALESPYVTKHLHHWIDLIFGYKQRGEAAIEATNVFHHLSYHGAQDLDSIQDPVEKKASIGIIHNFGQTPNQIFHRPHSYAESQPRYRSIDSAAETLRGTSHPYYETPERIGTLLIHPKLDRVIHCSPTRTYVPLQADKHLDIGFIDSSLRFFSTESKKQIAIYEHLHQGPIVAAEFLDSKSLITAGDDAVLAVWSVVHVNKTVEITNKCNFFGHRAGITAIAIAKPFATLVSADALGRVLIWDLNRGEFIRELIASTPDKVRQIRVHQETGDIALICGQRQVRLFSLNGKELVSMSVCMGSEDEVSCLAWCEKNKGEWPKRRLLCTGHKDGNIKIWQKIILPTGEWTLMSLRVLQHPAPPAAVAQINAILPLAQTLYAGDDNGRVYEWHVSKRD